MTASAPLLNTNFVLDGVKDILVDAHRHVEHDDFKYRRLLDEAKKVIHASPAEGHLLTAFTKQVSGDLEAVRGHLENALRFGATKLQTSEVGMTCYLNLGVFSAAKHCYSIAGDPVNGGFSDTYELGMACGAFRQHQRFEELAMRMKINVDDSSLRSKYHSAVEVLNETGTSDEEISELLDIAGEMLLERKLFFVGPLPDLCVLNDADNGQCVFLTLAIAEAPEIVSDMMFDLAGRAASRMARIPPGFGVGFSSSLQ